MMTQDSTKSNGPKTPGAPRWVKTLAIIGIVVLAALAMLYLTGNSSLGNNTVTVQQWSDGVVKTLHRTIGEIAHSYIGIGH